MSQPLVITFAGPDRAGLVAAISDAVTAHDGVWLESRLARLAGQFAGIVRADAPETKAEALEAALRALPGLTLAITRGGDGAPAETRRLRLQLIGLDRPGIVRDATRALAALGVNIAEFESDLRAAPFSGLPMFHARALLETPPDVTEDAVRQALENLAGEFSAEFGGAEAGLTLSTDGS